MTPSISHRAQASEPLSLTIDGLSFNNVGFQEAAAWTFSQPPDHRIHYSSPDNPFGFGDLRFPEGDAPPSGFPVLVFLHGGAWMAKVSKRYTESLVEKLTAQGFATWDLEFRRLGHPGGGYPGTFDDIADGLDHLRQLASDYPLDLDRVVAVGHSSGGHLALWLAGRQQISEDSPLFRNDPLPLNGVISIAGVNDLELALSLGNRTDVLQLAGVDSLDSGRDRLNDIDPGRLLPLGVPQTLVIGDRDASWRIDMTRRYQAKARQLGDAVHTVMTSGANHFDVVDPQSGIAEWLADAASQMLNDQAQ